MVSPTKEYALVELKDEYEHIQVTEQKYSTKTRGVCLSVGVPEDEYLVGKTIYWESYKDDTTIERDGKKLAFIKVEYIMGYDNE